MNRAATAASPNASFRDPFRRTSASACMSATRKSKGSSTSVKGIGSAPFHSVSKESGGCDGASDGEVERVVKVSTTATAAAAEREESQTQRAARRPGSTGRTWVRG